MKKIVCNYCNKAFFKINRHQKSCLNFNFYLNLEMDYQNTLQLVHTLLMANNKEDQIMEILNLSITKMDLNQLQLKVINESNKILLRNDAEHRKLQLESVYFSKEQDEFAARLLKNSGSYQEGLKFIQAEKKFIENYLLVLKYHEDFLFDPTKDALDLIEKFCKNNKSSIQTTKRIKKDEITEVKEITESSSSSILPSPLPPIERQTSLTWLQKMVKKFN